MDSPFVMQQRYPAPIEQVWEALTNENSMWAWYFPQLKRFEPVVSFAFEFAADGEKQVPTGLYFSWSYRLRLRKRAVPR
ncbi:hypothetical protein [Hymenobacter cellulosilyticus]|uniref:SRPBCC domain-containing protein n=1 Tax=Hymenobacter cellulosilyticus TaxID=2932248 RepID=A0A8T9PZC9_9BACT|nr:hypothetical protein [Hymenobacter cellulosilyticus]UOQ70105.1 hypothetical protein MUN79_15140 [Hymenobacter cellulosilyticus]